MKQVEYSFEIRNHKKLSLVTAWALTLYSVLYTFANIGRNVSKPVKLVLTITSYWQSIFERVSIISAQRVHTLVNFSQTTIFLQNIICKILCKFVYISHSLCCVPISYEFRKINLHVKYHFTCTLQGISREISAKYLCVEFNENSMPVYNLNAIFFNLASCIAV